MFFSSVKASYWNLRSVKCLCKTSRARVYFHDNRLNWSAAFASSISWSWISFCVFWKGCCCYFTWKFRFVIFAFYNVSALFLRLTSPIVESGHGNRAHSIVRWPQCLELSLSILKFEKYFQGECRFYAIYLQHKTFLK